ncbi:MAG: ribbon-helix-helix domain-containing protein [Thermoplasmatales archaeon]|nr:ribbon-helix-helix domain-containing protein [Candidatus Thermoplasmatota archaeon]MCG2827061.1 ribbon-helix-helix domain-containing protein [Thermoplasmatales archaeon]
MPKTSRRYRYGGITLPEPLIKSIEEFIEERPELGYSSTAEFVKGAVREKIEKYEEQNITPILKDLLEKIAREKK